MQRVLIFLWLISLTIISYAQQPEFNPELREMMIQHKVKHYQQMILCEKQKTPNQDDYDVKYYALDLTPNPITRILDGKVNIISEVVAPTLNHIELNFWDGMSITDVHLANIPNIQLNYHRNANILSIDLDTTYSKGEQFSLEITYNGRPQNSGFHAFGFDRHDGKPMIWTLSEPFGARSWWPCKDLPSDKADSVDIRVTVPSDLIVASNGILRETYTESGKTTYWWHEQYPIVTYLVSLAIYPYKVYYDNYLYNNNADTMRIHFYVFPDNYNQYSVINAKVKDMIGCFASLFGEYPFVKEKYGHADFLGGGAMEHQTCTSFAFWGEMVYAHELAHQWWGDMITCNSFHHIWLNEGFATYSEALWFERINGPGAASFYQMHYNLYLGPGTIYVEDPEHQPIFHGGLSYSKGSWVLHMLRHVVGDSVFFKILKAYYASPEHQYGTATTEDFQAICEQISRKNLERFFHQWIYEEWFPQYSYYWQHENNKVYGVVTQIQQHGPIFEMPLDITIQTTSGDTTIVLLSDEQSEYFEYIVNSEPIDVLLDKDNWVLKTVTKIDKPMFSVKNYYIDDSNENDNGRAEPGETVNLIVEIENQGLSATNVKLTLKSEDADITMIDGINVFNEIDMGAVVSNQTEPFIFSISQTATGHLSEFRLCFSTETDYCDSVAIDIPIGYPSILVVDDDAGNNYETFINSILNENKLFYDVWDVQQQGLPSVSEKYMTLIWSTGDDRQTTLTSIEQALLTTFLDNGGKLLLNGQNIGYDLVEDGSAADSLFYLDYLHAQYIMDTADDPWVLGVSGDPIGSQLYVFLEGEYGGAGNQSSTDVIEPVEPAISFLYYAIIKHSAGIYYEGQTTGCRVVYLPFGLEGIAGPNPTSASMLVDRIMAWLSGKTSVEDGNEEVLKRPEIYYLYSNYPNPFNPQTTIRFDLPEQTNIILKVYNLLGQEVITLLNEVKPAGSFEVVWDGKNNLGKRVPTGVYLYRLETEKFTCTHKMLLRK